MTNGNATTNYTYDAVGGLRRVVKPNGDDFQYVLDGAGRRVWKKLNGALVQGFVYADGLRPVAELDGTGQVVARFIYGRHVNVPEVMIKNGTTYRIVTDHLGSPRFVVNTAAGAGFSATVRPLLGRGLAGLSWRWPLRVLPLSPQVRLLLTQYRDIAQRAIDAPKDPLGVQAARLDFIKKCLGE